MKKQNAIATIQSKAFFDYTSNQASGNEVSVMVEISPYLIQQHKKIQHYLVKK